MHRYRSHTCGALTSDRYRHRGATFRLIHPQRDHGGVLFIDLRDHYGLTQVVVYPDKAFQDAVATAQGDRAAVRRHGRGGAPTAT